MLRHSAQARSLRIRISSSFRRVQAVPLTLISDIIDRIEIRKPRLAKFRGILSPIGPDPRVVPSVVRDVERGISGFRDNIIFRFDSEVLTAQLMGEWWQLRYADVAREGQEPQFANLDTGCTRDRVLDREVSIAVAGTVRLMDAKGERARLHVNTNPQVAAVRYAQEEYVCGDFGVSEVHAIHLAY